MADGLKISGIDFYNKTMRDLLNDIAVEINEGGLRRIIVPVNTDVLLKAMETPWLMDFIHRAWRVTPDGMPIIWLSRLAGQSLPERITGSDLTRELCFFSSDWGVKAFLLGAAPKVAQRVKEIGESEYSDSVISGTYSPAPEELKDPGLSQRIVDMINDSGANVLLVALGAPKQEIWINDNMDRLNTSIIIGVGASFDFLAGIVPRAPRWMQKIGLEWFFRLCVEPRRLFWRYFSNFRVIMIAVKIMCQRCKLRLGGE